MALMDRAKNILLQPTKEWPVIDTEQTSIAGLYTGYIIPLAAIGPLASLIGWSVFGMRLPFVGSMKIPFSFGIRNAVIVYVLSLVGVFVLGLIIDALAPTFAGQKNQIQALKVAAYSYTAAWVGGIFNLIPSLAIIGLLISFYSLYLLYLGLPVLMKAPQDKAVGYTVVVIIVAIVLYLIIGVVVAQFAWHPAMGGMPGL
jgi:Yip1-like protein